MFLATKSPHPDSLATNKNTESENQDIPPSKDSAVGGYCRLIAEDSTANAAAVDKKY